MAIFPLLNDTKHRPFCGPTAISVLTGVPVSRAEKMIRRARNDWMRKQYGERIKPNMQVKGTYSSEVVTVLKRLGCKVKSVAITESTFHKFVDDTRHVGTFLVNVTGHFIVADKGLVVDGRYPMPTPIEDHHKPAWRVKRAWQIIAPSVPKYSLDDAIATARPAKPKRDIRTVRAEKVAADIKRWERKEKLAKTKLKKLRAKLKYYQKNNIGGES